MDILKGIVTEALRLLSEKLKILWPSSAKTPPTESNLVTAFAESFAIKGCLTYTEVPIRTGGRIDLVAIDPQEMHTMYIVELKSESPTYRQQMLTDQSRMRAFTPDQLYYRIERMDIRKVWLLQAIWSETPKTREYLSTLAGPSKPIDSAIDAFGAMVQSSLLRGFSRLSIDQDQTLSVLYFASPKDL